MSKVLENHFTVFSNKNQMFSEGMGIKNCRGLQLFFYDLTIVFCFHALPSEGRQKIRKCFPCKLCL